MKPDPARAYRQVAAQGASPVSLAAQAYDQIVRSLYEAIHALKSRNYEKKTQDLNHALTLISRLQNALNFESGRDVAEVLQRFYNVERAQILEGSAKSFS